MFPTFNRRECSTKLLGFWILRFHENVPEKLLNFTLGYISKYYEFHRFLLRILGVSCFSCFFFNNYQSIWECQVLSVLFLKALAHFLGLLGHFWVFNTGFKSRRLTFGVHPENLATSGLFWRLQSQSKCFNLLFDKFKSILIRTASFVKHQTLFINILVYPKELWVLFWPI